MTPLTKTIHPAERLRGDVTVPGDKSISHRALMLGALCKGDVAIDHLAAGEDVRSTAGCLQTLGVQIEKSARKFVVHGVGLNGLRATSTPLDAGNSGTTMRLLSGILAGQPWTSKITGDESLRKRDMSRIINPLKEMGAQVSSHEGLAPLTIWGGALRGITYTLPVASSQVKSCLLLAALYAKGTTLVISPSPTRDHTERMLRFLEVDLNIEGYGVSLKGKAQPTAHDLSVPGDFSSAAFFIAAATLVSESNLVVKNVGVNPTRTRFLNLLNKMGGRVTQGRLDEKNNEPRTDLEIQPARLRGIEIQQPDVPLVIDEIPILAVLASQANGITVIRNASELRKKESDRIQSVVTNLSKMGAKIEELPDGMKIEGPAKLRGATLDSFGDHRIAMAFAVAGLVAEGETVIRNAEWADISFPGFFETLESISA